MTGRIHAMGKEGMVLAVIASIAMLTGAYFLDTDIFPGMQTGICLPSPQEWGLSGIGSWALNVGVMACSALALYLCNKEYSFVQGDDTVLTGMFIIMATSNPWISSTLTTSGLMVLGNILCLSILFGCYRKRNATQELFLIGTVLAIGSMVQYAFVFMMPVYLIGAILLKCFNFKGLIAFFMGVAAPYWIGVGFGLIPLEAFRMPSFTSLFDEIGSKSKFFVGLVNIAVTVLLSLFLALNNTMKLYAGNKQRRLYNVVLNLLGCVSIVCILLDFNNLTAYLATIYMLASVQLANLFSLWEIRRGSLWLLALSGLYIAGYVLML